MENLPCQKAVGCLGVVTMFACGLVLTVTGGVLVSDGPKERYSHSVSVLLVNETYGSSCGEETTCYKSLPVDNGSVSCKIVVSDVFKSPGAVATVWYDYSDLHGNIITYCNADNPLDKSSFLLLIVGLCVTVCSFGIGKKSKF